ncbi:MAG: hypothetical protein KGH65_02355 [Candidatus Micrarchaeota archaeon]|nr:hypothetical protein [Candidatus Micrarchaeota archaeon]
MEVAQAEVPRTKTKHVLSYFESVLGDGGVNLDIYFQRRGEKEEQEEKLIGFNATPPETTMINGKPTPDRRRNLELVDGFLSLCDKNQVPVEILVARFGLAREESKIVQVSDDDLPRDRLTIHRFEDQIQRSSELVFFGKYKDYAGSHEYIVHIQAAVVIPDVIEQIKALERP